MTSVGVTLSVWLWSGLLIILSIRWGQKMGEWGFWDWIGYITLVIAAVSIAIDTAISQSHRLQKHLPRLFDKGYWGFVPIIMVSLSAFAFGYKQLNASSLKIEKPEIVVDNSVEFLGPKDARLEVSSWDLRHFDDGKTTAVTAQVVNTDSVSAFSYRAQGNILLTKHILPELEISEQFAYVAAKLKHTYINPGSEISPTNKGLFYNIPNGPPVSYTQAQVESGLLLYLFNIIEYSEAGMPPNKSIYVESCLYFLNGVQHLCETGHNKSYKGPSWLKAF